MALARWSFTLSFLLIGERGGGAAIEIIPHSVRLTAIFNRPQIWASLFSRPVKRPPTPTFATTLDFILLFHAFLLSF
jgi:hypothetical protein